MQSNRRRIALAALAAALGCAPGMPFESRAPNRLGAWVPESTATVMHTGTSSLDNPTMLVVSDTGQWRTLWTEAWKTSPVFPSVPGFDFVTTSVVVVGLGWRAGPGYEVTIDSVVSYTTGAVLYATSLEPGAHCDISTGTSAPVHMVHAPDHPPVVEWRVSINRRDC